ncbi:MAG: LPS export ABC transporter permease LptF [Gammaproteobacteria bacterium]|nr:LPS export ABC transporter permease LptF [Gammaproteobacteria bacterium]
MIIDRHISLEILRPFVAGLGLLVLVYIGFSAARHLSMAAAGQMDMLTAFKLIGLSTLITLEILLPSAFFFSILSAIGRLYRDSEMSAFYAAGVSRARILEAVLKLALVVALITGLISIMGRPWAFRTSYALESQAEAQFDLKKMAAGEFLNMGGSDYTFIAKDLDLEQGLHRGVFLQKEHDRENRTEIIVAEAAAMPTLNPGQGLQATFYNGYHYLIDNAARRDVTLEFKELVIRLANQEAQEKYRRKAETTFVLSDSDDPKDIAEYQWRISTPLATVLLALFAVPLARSAPRESRFRNFSIAIAAYIALFSMVSVLRSLLEQDRLGAFPGLWIAYAVQALLLLLLVSMPKLRALRRRT